MIHLEVPPECSICSQRVARFWAQAATYGPPTPDDQFESEIGISGFCRDHRDAVLEKLTEALRTGGEVLSIMDPPIELRPHEIDPFLNFVDEWLRTRDASR